jgi:hypothetical protein
VPVVPSAPPPATATPPEPVVVPSASPAKNAVPKKKSRGLGALAGDVASRAHAVPPPKPKKKDLLNELSELHAEACAEPLAQQTSAQLRKLAETLGKLQSRALALADQREEQEMLSEQQKVAAAGKEALAAFVAQKRRASALEEVNSMSLPALRSLIDAAGLDIDDCLEKDDLQARAREAITRLADDVGEHGTGREAAKPIW